MLHKIIVSMIIGWHFENFGTGITRKAVPLVLADYSRAVQFMNRGRLDCAVC